VADRPADEGVTIRSVSLGGSALSVAAQRGALPQWYTRCPVGADGWRAHAQQVRDTHGAEWLAPLAPAFAATGAAAERLQRAAAGGIVVTTGQQPGLFGGPLYTFSKAMSALALADALEAATGIPVAPVFWAATDDADWAESASTHVVGARGLERLALEGPPTDGVALSEVRLGDLSAARAALAAACGSAAHARVLQAVDAAYVPQATIGAAYVQLLRACFEPLGIAVLDASHVAVRRAADPFLRDALRKAPAVREALRARTTAIEAAGYAPQVELVDALSNVFVSTVESDQTGVRRVRTRVPIARAEATAREAEVGALGANVLLRPVLERALLPTACYVAGPGEYAYFAQVSSVAEALASAAPLAVPRWAGEVRPPDVDARLERLGLAEAQLFDAHTAEQAVARRHMDDTTADQLERLRVTLEAQMAALIDTLANDGGPVAPAVAEGLARDVAARLDRFERRLLAGVKRREVEAMREIAVLRAYVRPHGQSPERVLNAIPFLARFGPDVLLAMRDAAAGHARRLIEQGIVEPQPAGHGAVAAS